MKNILILVLSFILIMLVTTRTCYADNTVKDTDLITTDSIGIVKVGTPLKELEKIAKSLGYKIKKGKTEFVLFDEKKLPLITFTVFNSHTKKPVRTIKTTSSKFKTKEGLSLLGSPLSKLEEVYSTASIYRIKPRKEAPEFINFKNWPFKESIIQDGLIFKYKVQLNKIVDEYGHISPVGKYENEFCLYTKDYKPEARIESFLIEAIEPKIKFKNKTRKKKDD